MTHVGLSITDNSCTIPTFLQPIGFISPGGICSLCVFLSTKLFSPPLFVLNFSSSIFQWLLADLQPFTSIHSGIWYHLSSFQGQKWQHNDLVKGLIDRFTAKSPGPVLYSTQREAARLNMPLRQCICFYCLQGHLSLIQSPSPFPSGLRYAIHFLPLVKP